MTKVKAPVEGVIHAIASKSYALRYMLCAALSKSPTTVTGLVTDQGQDIQDGLNILKALGCTLSHTPHETTITPPAALTPNIILDCGQSGALLRFLLPIMAALGTGATFIGTERLSQRPLADLRHTLLQGGVTLNDGLQTPDSPSDGAATSLHLTVVGRLAQTQYTLVGTTSSQYVSGMLLALPLVHPDQDKKLTVTGLSTSTGYIDMTLSVLRNFGIAVIQEGNTYTIPKNSCYTAPQRPVLLEGDWSNAACWMVAGAIAGDITVTGLRGDSLQRDKVIVSWLARMNARVTQTAQGIRVQRAPLEAISVDATHTPDLVPVFAIACACAKGTSRISGADRLVFKESNRLEAILESLKLMGIRASFTDALYIVGGHLHGASLPDYDDHRMVMMAALAALVSDGKVHMDAYSVAKSYIHFAEDYQIIGGTLNGF